jgi:hypothetical protein
MRACRRFRSTCKITAHPPHTVRPKRKGEVTFADTVKVTFPGNPKKKGQT